MSEWLITSINPSSALREISQIEEYCESSDPGAAIQIHRGPFGAFRVGEPQQACSGGITQHCSNTQSFEGDDLNDAANLALAVSHTADVASMQAFMSSMFEQPELFVADFGLQSSCNYFTSAVIHDITDEMSMLPSSQGDFDASVVASSLLVNQPNTPPVFSRLQHAQREITQEAVPLLKHYQSTVLPLLTPFRHSKTPWHILFVPQVKGCLAALTLSEDVDHATLCAFYATLSISALSLGGVLTSNRWSELARAYKKLACRHIKLVMASAYDVPKKAKYKSILIALLSMVQLSIVCGTEDQIQRYLIEAENFIRVRGLPRRKSRKVRLLHHCYAFERILFESTRIEALSADQGHDIDANVTSLPQYAISFRLSHWTHLEQEMLRTKTREEGENDLHLQIPGEWSATLYPEIFGVPEQWILLVSLIIQLAKEKDDDNQLFHRSKLSVKDFLHRAKAIETAISRLQRSASDPELDNLLEAMRHALAIYFYRRIYDVDSSMLQQKVASICECLQRSDEIVSPAAHGAARFIWPAIVAAREAESIENQVCLTNWFQNAARRAGLHLFITALANVKAIWEAKKATFVPCSRPI